jgi:hypothetical protein
MTRTIPAAKRTMSALLPAVLLAAAAAAGCGENKTGNLSGTVTFQGKPMPGGYIFFTNVASDGRVIAQKSGGISENGTYSVAKVPIGDVKITLQEPTGDLPANLPSKGGMPQRAPPPVTLPPKYTSVEQTDLKYTVTPGDQKFDIVMK